MCEVFPKRRVELDLYEADIGNMFDYYGSLFYQYHVQFSMKAAAYLEKGIKVDWPKRDTNMFQLIVGGAKSKLCDNLLLLWDCGNKYYLLQGCNPSLIIY